MNNEECSKCRFWERRSWEHYPTVAESDRGRCRRHPPEGDGVWPIVHKDGWCGEFKVVAADNNDKCSMCGSGITKAEKPCSVWVEFMQGDGNVTHAPVVCGACGERVNSGRYSIKAAYDDKGIAVGYEWSEQHNDDNRPRVL